MSKYSRSADSSDQYCECDSPEHGPSCPSVLETESDRATWYDLR